MLHPPPDFEPASYPKVWLVGKKLRLVNVDVVESMRRIPIQEMNRKVSCVRCDVSVEDDVDYTIEWAVARHSRLDVLCNNAGVLGRQTRAAKSILSFDTAEFDRMLCVNTLAMAPEILRLDWIDRGPTVGDLQPPDPARTPTPAPSQPLAPPPGPHPAAADGLFHTVTHEDERHRIEMEK